MALTIKLHPAQDAFLKSDALFRAFVGGIGSGKSWAGAYDVLKRSKPGRLYETPISAGGKPTENFTRAERVFPCFLGQTFSRFSPPSTFFGRGVGVTLLATEVGFQAVSREFASTLPPFEFTLGPGSSAKTD